MEEKIKELYKSDIAELCYGKKEIMIDLFKTLEKYNVKSYKEISNKLKEASELASIIATI